MSNGVAGIGSVPAYNPHNEAAGSLAYDDRLTVSAVWSSYDSGVELSGGEIDGHYYLTNAGALKLAELLLKASQPANMPGNGYEEWAAAARKAVERAFDPAQGFEFDGPDGPGPYERHMATGDLLDVFPEREAELFPTQTMHAHAPGEPCHCGEPPF